MPGLMKKRMRGGEEEKVEVEEDEEVSRRDPVNKSACVGEVE